SYVSGQQQAHLHWKRAKSATQEPAQTPVQAHVPLESADSLSLNFFDSQDCNALVGSLAVPFVHNTFSYMIADSEYQHLIGTTTLLYGRTLSHIFGWNYLVSRNTSDITSVDTTLSWCLTDSVVRPVMRGAWPCCALAATGYISCSS
ncbi:ShlB/FhaC/HecB family hemolysin secretion/activation protein, partial [Burkholderia territorii]|uniref:ShlB/FhaC/HecB family hemolysin secretion/activation protein n=1 Tax=Burkholderia territorii TaxID=1503055 RepID=UPI000A91DD2F